MTEQWFQVDGKALRRRAIGSGQVSTKSILMLQMSIRPCSNERLMLDQHETQIEFNVSQPHKPQLMHREPLSWKTGDPTDRMHKPPFEIASGI